MTGDAPAVDVVIAAHDPARRVDRAVASALEAGPDVRVTVVAHGVPASAFGAVGETSSGALRIVEFSDGIRSPAGPFNYGLSLAEAEYVSIQGSDDFLERGALRAWRDQARRVDADYVIPVLRDQDGAVWRDPLTRARRSDHLDLVRDRLAYRAAPLGLIRRSALPSTQPLTEGLATGEDIDLGLRLAAAGSVSFARAAPAYVIGADAPQRVTLAPRPLADELRALLLLLERDWVAGLNAASRCAIAIKLWRMNLIPALVVRADGGWDADDAHAVRSVVGGLRRMAPNAERSLSTTEDAIARAAVGGDPVLVRAAVESARAAGPLHRALTRHPAHVFDIDAPLRRLLALRRDA